MNKNKKINKEQNRKNSNFLNFLVMKIKSAGLN